MNDITRNGSLDSKDNKEQISQPTESSLPDSASVYSTDNQTEPVEIFFLEQDESVGDSPHQDNELSEPSAFTPSFLSRRVASIIVYWIIAFLCLLISIGTIVLIALTKGASPTVNNTPDLTQTLNVVILSAIPKTPTSTPSSIPSATPTQKPTITPFPTNTATISPSPTTTGTVTPIPAPPTLTPARPPEDPDTLQLAE